MWNRVRVLFILSFLGLRFGIPFLSAESAPNNRVQLTLDASEADQVLAILTLRADGKPVDDSQWQRLFATEPYQRLKKREAEIGQQFHDPTLAFTDSDFKKFVLSEDLRGHVRELSSTLDAWKKADLRASADRALAYLPATATIRAKVYPMIKPKNNSFVWGPPSDPAIFLYLDPGVSREKFENTVAHELHHIGLRSLGPLYDQKIAALPERARAAADWMGSFGEGFAMLAAAGAPDVDPHAASAAREHARWDHDMANFSSDLRSVNGFFTDTLNGKFPNQDAIDEKGSSFFGAQGPWCTVGYKMAVTVEKRFGRPALIETMLDPRCLLVLYNHAASEQNAAGKEQLPMWSDSVLAGVSAPSCAATARP